MTNKKLARSQRGYFASIVGAYYDDEHGGTYMVDYGEDNQCFINKTGKIFTDGYSMNQELLAELDRSLVEQIRDEVKFILSIIGDEDDQ